MGKFLTVLCCGFVFMRMCFHRHPELTRWLEFKHVQPMKGMTEKLMTKFFLTKIDSR